MSTDRVFTKEELSEITEIVRTENVEAASRKFCNRPTVFFTLRKSYKELADAIAKGQQQRKEETPLKRAFRYFEALAKEELKEITELVKESGVTAVAEKYGFSIHSINACRKELPKLDEAIKIGIRSKPTGAAIPHVKDKIVQTRNEKKNGTSTVCKPKDKTRKPPREIVDKTILAIEDNTTEAWQNFKRTMRENKERALLKSIKNGYYDNMV